MLFIYDKDNDYKFSIVNDIHYAPYGDNMDVKRLRRFFNKKTIRTSGKRLQKYIRRFYVR